MGKIISSELARKLKEAGLKWRPATGDRFLLAESLQPYLVCAVAEKCLLYIPEKVHLLINQVASEVKLLEEEHLVDLTWLPRLEQLTGCVEDLGYLWEIRAFTKSGSNAYKVELWRTGRNLDFYFAGSVTPVDAVGTALMKLLGGDIDDL